MDEPTAIILGAWKDGSLVRPLSETAREPELKAPVSMSKLGTAVPAGNLTQHLGVETGRSLEPEGQPIQWK